MSVRIKLLLGVLIFIAALGAAMGEILAEEPDVPCVLDPCICNTCCPTCY